MAQAPIANYERGTQTFLLKKSLIKLIGSEFFVYAENGSLVCKAHQKGFKLKEHIRFFQDEAMTQPYMEINAQQVIDFSGSYAVTDAAGVPIGIFKRKGWKSMLRDEWELYSPEGALVGNIVEDSMVMAILRRFLSNLIPQNYDLNIGGQRAVDLKQNFNPFSYHLNIILERPDLIDPRMAIAAGVMLGIFEKRQGTSILGG